MQCRCNASVDGIECVHNPKCFVVCYQSILCVAVDGSLLGVNDCGEVVENAVECFLKMSLPQVVIMLKILLCQRNICYTVPGLSLVGFVIKRVSYW